MAFIAGCQSVSCPHVEMEMDGEIALL